MPLSKLLKIFGNVIEKKTIKNKNKYVLKKVFDFGVWYEATTMRDMRPFDSGITDC